MTIKLNAVEELLYSQKRREYPDDEEFKAAVKHRRGFINNVLRRLIAKEEIAEVTLKQFVALHPEADDSLLTELFMEDSETKDQLGRYEGEVHDSVLSNYRIFTQLK
jgi:hypothetical protein